MKSHHSKKYRTIALLASLFFLDCGLEAQVNISEQEWVLPTLLISEADKRIKSGEETDFFAKFGEKEAASVRLSNAYLLKGLGYKGLGDKEKASENLKKALELSASNLYARVELE